MQSRNQNLKFILVIANKCPQMTEAEGKETNNGENFEIIFLWNMLYFSVTSQQQQLAN